MSRPYPPRPTRRSAGLLYEVPIVIQAVACSDGRKLVGEKGLRAELATTVRAGLGEDHLEVVLDGPRGDEELGRDSSGVEALRDGFDLPEQVLDYRA